MIGKAMSERPKKPQPSFQVRLTGTGLVPERVPLRAFTDTLSAVQRLASGRSAEDESPHANPVSLLDIRRGSAVYECVAKDANFAVSRFESLGQMLGNPESAIDQDFDDTLSPLEELSGIARKLRCVIQIRKAIKPHNIIAEIDADAFRNVSQHLIVEGTTNLSGTIVRVGGATDMKCVLRLPMRQRLLYCNVANSDLLRELGKRLYQDVIATGHARWLQRTWWVYSFKVSGIEDKPKGKILAGLRAMYEAGGSHWDEVSNPEALIKELRQ